jgi:DNA-3-methyladenine glycosylase II
LREVSLVLPEAEDAAALVLAGARRRLARADRRLAAVMRAIGPCGLRRRPGGFPSLFRSIVHQQLSGKAAATIAARLHLACGGTAAAETVAALDDASFAACGVSRQKRDYLRGLASAALEAPDRFTRLEPLADEAAIAELIALKGVGRWTAEMYLLFALGRLDILPLGDLSIRAAIAELYELPAAAPPAAVAAVAEAWRPYRSVACWYLYAHLDRRRKPR